MRRRGFIQTILASSAAGTLFAAPLHRAWAENAPQIPIALQVYSVREAAAKDLAGVLQRIAKIGYRGVEFAGTYGHSADEVKKMLDDAGLLCIGAHLGIEALLGDTFEETAAYQETLGNKTLTVAGGLAQAIAADPGNKFTAYLFNELARKAKSRGFRIGFHAHGADFADVGGKTAWDLFFERTDAEVTAQMDIGNCLSSGADPYESMKRFPGRGRQIHLKACGPGGTVIGGENDRVDWKRAFEICETTAGTEWYIVEQENGPDDADPFTAVTQCWENLKKMGKG